MEGVLAGEEIPVLAGAAVVGILQALGEGIPCSPWGLVQVEGDHHEGEDPGSSSLLPGSNLRPFHEGDPSCPVHDLCDPHTPLACCLVHLVALHAYIPPKVRKLKNKINRETGIGRATQFFYRITTFNLKA